MEQHPTLSLLVPGRRFNVLAGRMQGTKIPGADTQLCTTRIVLLRTVAGPSAAPQCFVPEDGAALAADPVLPADLNDLVGLTLGA